MRNSTLNQIKNEMGQNITKFEYYNNLGFINSYYTKQNNRIVLYDDFQNVFLDPLRPKTLDISGIIEIISRGFFFHDRTLIKEVKKTPWLGKPNDDYTNWEYFNPPSHSFNVYDIEKISSIFYSLLENELINYCSNKKNVGILLSGGMDSRITAGILKNLIIHGRLSCDVVAITWGIENSRDVVYAKEISNRFGWEWVHFSVTPEKVYNNIFVAAENGCEFAPYHLHAMSDVAEIDGIEVILASSYGDSIGRGVYSSRHLLNLTPLKDYIKNWYGLLDNVLFSEYKTTVLADLDFYSNKYPRNYKWQSYEIERQAIYMRRLLNPCFSIINKKIPVRQTFSSPEVVSYIWSIHPKLRNDKLYEYIVYHKMKNIRDIPWSKTGKKFGNNSSADNSDPFLKDYHNYAKWIRNDLYKDIYKLCLSNEINSTNIFDMQTLDILLKFNSKLKTNFLTQIDTVSIWLASLAILLKNNSQIEFTPNIRPIFDNKYLNISQFIANTSFLILKKRIKNYFK